MALADSYPYSRSSSFSAARSPDAAPSVHLHRAIKPLPKSRLKSKLSPEQAATIKYPPNPPPISPTLNFSSPVDGRRHSDEREGHYHHEPALVHEHCSCSHGDDSEHESVEFDHPDYRYATTASPLTGGKSEVHDSVQRRLMDAAKITHDGRTGAVASTASSADGYESFENTSNKKKRKIPLSTMSASHQSRLSAELANMGIRADGEHEEAADTRLGQTYDHQTQGVAGTGISGAGRGRFGRRDAKDGRRPLANTTVNVPYAGRMPRGGDSKDYDPASPQTPGIISRALRTAAEAGPLTPQKGKENVSLLQQNASASPKTQFTFTCESDSGNKLLEQQPLAKRDRSAATYNPAYNGQRPAAPRQGQQAGQPPRAPAQMPPPAQPHAAQPQQKPVRPRRSPSKEYALAARQRQLQQQYQNLHHKPRSEDMWICQFCEYEDIFGMPPVALIRQYEIRDRQERKKAAEKRRLLEKAKQRGRKGKKGSKSAGKNAAAPAPARDQHYDQHGGQLDDDEYYEDEEPYDDDDDAYDPLPVDGEEGQYDSGHYYEHPPPPVPLSTPQPLMSHARAGG